MTNKKDILWAVHVNETRNEVLTRIGEYLVSENIIEASRNTPGRASRRALLEFLIEEYIDFFDRTNPTVIYGEVIEIEKQKDSLDEIRLKQMQQLQEVQKRKLTESNMEKRKLQDVIDKRNKELEEIKIGAKNG
jgi:hypothetical protein